MSSSLQNFYSERDLDAKGILTRVTRWRLRKRGLFPEPINLSEGRKAYPAEAIEKWVADRIAESSRKSL